MVGKHPLNIVMPVLQETIVHEFRVKIGYFLFLVVLTLVK